MGYSRTSASTWSDRFRSVSFLVIFLYIFLLLVLDLNIFSYPWIVGLSTFQRICMLNAFLGLNWNHPKGISSSPSALDYHRKKFGVIHVFKIHVVHNTDGIVYVHAYAQADLRLCWSHIPHCWKFHVAAHRYVESRVPQGSDVFVHQTVQNYKYATRRRLPPLTSTK